MLSRFQRCVFFLEPTSGNIFVDLDARSYLDRKYREEPVEAGLEKCVVAFEIPAEFPASFAKFGFGENLAPEVPNEGIRLVSAVRFRNLAGP
jgi:hypothetical protein